jgi:hypothetical protein
VVLIRLRLGGSKESQPALLWMGQRHFFETIFGGIEIAPPPKGKLVAGKQKAEIVLHKR